MKKGKVQQTVNNSDSEDLERLDTSIFPALAKTAVEVSQVSHCLSSAHKFDKRLL